MLIKMHKFVYTLYTISMSFVEVICSIRNRF